MTAPRALVPLAWLLHVLLFAWAWHAWQIGPFRGEAILDAAEYAHAARSGGLAIDTKSPLYPWLLGPLLERGVAPHVAAGLFGLLSSLAVLGGIGALCRRARVPQAAPWATCLWACSGSVIALGLQPLEVLPATAALVWGVLLATEAVPRRAIAGGALLGALVLARAALVPAALLALAGTSVRRGLACAGLGAVLVAGLLLFGARAWPEGAGLNLRLGNGAQRSGIADIRPGPAYDSLRSAARFAQYAALSEGAGPVSTDRHHLERLVEEVSAAPVGAGLTLLRKLYLFFHRTEIFGEADARHGLSRWRPAPVLLQLYGLVAPLALAFLLRRREPLLVLPVLGVLCANVLFLTSARYRLPALPFLCVAGGATLAGLGRARDLLLPAALALALVPNLSGVALIVPGDGSAQEGRALLAAAAGDTDRLAAAVTALRRATAEGRDPRASYDLGLALETLAGLPPDELLLSQAEAAYRAALQLEPGYPQAAENLMQLLIVTGRREEALAFGEDLRVVPEAGMILLNLAALRPRGSADVPLLLAEGHRILALRSLAQNEFAGARWHAAQLHALGSMDPALDELLAQIVPADA